MPARLLLTLSALALLGGALLVGGALWRATHELSPAGPAQGTAREPVADEVALVPPGAAARSAETGAQREVTSTTNRTPAPAAAPRRTLVRGRVSVPLDEPGSIAVTLDGRAPDGSDDGRRPMRLLLQPDDHGAFEADVTSLLGPASLLLVRATHRGCKPAEVVLGNLRAERGGDAAAPGFGPGPRVVEVSLELDPLGGRIAGRVVLPPGADERVVVVVALGGEGRAGTITREEDRRVFVVPGAAGDGSSPRRLGDARAGGSSVAVSHDGGFELHVDAGGRYTVVAAASGLRPCAVDLDVSLEGTYVVDLALERGAAITGTLRLDEGPAPPGTLLYATPARHDERSVALGQGLGTLRWVDGAPEWAHPLTSVGARGRFALEGLGPQAYDLFAVGLGVEGRNQRSLYVVRARAPAEELELGPLLVRVRLDFGPGAEPTSFRLHPLDGHPAWDLGPFDTDPGGIAQLLLPPESAFEVLVEDDVVGRITTAAAGRLGTWRLSR